MPKRSTLFPDIGWPTRIFFTYVRFTLESGHVRCSWGCPLWAKSGHSLKQSF